MRFQPRRTSDFLPLVFCPPTSGPLVKPRSGFTAWATFRWPIAALSTQATAVTCWLGNGTRRKRSQSRPRYSKRLEKNEHQTHRRGDRKQRRLLQELQEMDGRLRRAGRQEL